MTRLSRPTGALAKDFMSEGTREAVLAALQALGCYEAGGVRDLRAEELDNYRCCVIF